MQSLEEFVFFSTLSATLPKPKNPKVIEFLKKPKIRFYLENKIHMEGILFLSSLSILPVNERICRSYLSIILCLKRNKVQQSIQNVEKGFWRRSIWEPQFINHENADDFRDISGIKLIFVKRKVICKWENKILSM